MFKIQEYFTYEPPITQAKGWKSVKKFIGAKYSDWIYELKRKADRFVKKNPGKSRRDCPPTTVSEAVWNSMCTYWEDPKFLELSDKMSSNRMQLQVPHHSGATSFLKIFKV